MFHLCLRPVFLLSCRLQAPLSLPRSIGEIFPRKRVPRASGPLRSSIRPAMMEALPDILCTKSHPSLLAQLYTTHPQSQAEGPLERKAEMGMCIHQMRSVEEVAKAW